MTRIVSEVQPLESSESIRSTIKVVKSLGDDNPANAETISVLEAKLEDALEKESAFSALEFHYRKLWDEAADFVIDNHRYAATQINAKEGLGKQFVAKLVELGWNPPRQLSALVVVDTEEGSVDVGDTVNYDALDEEDEGKTDEEIMTPPPVEDGPQFNTLDSTDN